MVHLPRRRPRLVRMQTRPLWLHHPVLAQLLAIPLRHVRLFEPPAKLRPQPPLRESIIVFFSLGFNFVFFSSSIARGVDGVGTSLKRAVDDFCCCAVTAARSHYAPFSAFFGESISFCFYDFCENAFAVATLPFSNLFFFLFFFFLLSTCRHPFVSSSWLVSLASLSVEENVCRHGLGGEPRLAGR